MSAAALLIDRAGRAGIRLWREGDRLRYAGKADAVARLLSELKAGKAVLLEALAASSGETQVDGVEGQNPNATLMAVGLVKRTCLWRVPDEGGKSRYMVAGPEHDLRLEHAGAVPLFDEAHRQYVRRLADNALPAALLEALEERAAILEYDAGDAPRDAWVSAVRLEQCRRCRHFTPGPARPLTGSGACGVDGWAQRHDEADGQLAEPCLEWRDLE